MFTQIFIYWYINPDKLYDKLRMNSTQNQNRIYVHMYILE